MQKPAPAPPSNSVKIEGHNDYRYSGGRYWYHGDNGWCYVRPPYGIYVTQLPAGCYSWWFANRRYYYWGGVYYDYDDEDDTYVVVEAPDEAIVPDLPEDAELVTIGSDIYYKVGDLLYKPVMVDGETRYKVVKI